MDSKLKGHVVTTSWKWDLCVSDFIKWPLYSLLDACFEMCFPPWSHRGFKTRADNKPAVYFLFCFWDNLSCSPGWPLTCYVAQDVFEFLILPPPSPSATLKCTAVPSSPSSEESSGNESCVFQSRIKPSHWELKVLFQWKPSKQYFLGCLFGSLWTWLLLFVYWKPPLVIANFRWRLTWALGCPGNCWNTVPGVMCEAASGRS